MAIRLYPRTSLIPPLNQSQRKIDSGLEKILVVSRKISINMQGLFFSVSVIQSKGSIDNWQEENGCENDPDDNL